MHHDVHAEPACAFEKRVNCSSNIQESPLNTVGHSFTSGCLPPPGLHVLLLQDYQGYYDDDGCVVDYRNYDYQTFYSEEYGNASCDYSQQEGVVEVSDVLNAAGAHQALVTCYNSKC